MEEAQSNAAINAAADENGDAEALMGHGAREVGFESGITVITAEGEERLWGRK